MQTEIRKIIILGGGTAGWLTASIIASEHMLDQESMVVNVTLIESPNVSTIGVGEGTWPSMRTTLKRIGVKETDFFRKCSASFKQGTQFFSWTNKHEQSYAHPFTLPNNFAKTNLVRPWQDLKTDIPFAEAVCPQLPIFARHLAPKQISTPEYAGHLNYGYHLDAGKFADLLRHHATEALGVVHISEHVISVNNKENGDIKSLTTSTNEITGDLFIDCSGMQSMLLGNHFGIPLLDKHQYLFNDSALAAQVSYEDENHPIESCTRSTAQKAGWIWDIGLQTRRGAGYVYSSSHTSDEKAYDELLEYIGETSTNINLDSISPKKITFQPGHRTVFWHRNCVAIGMSAGFIEPLEASALVLVELSASVIADQLPNDRNHMDIVAKRFNKNFRRRWDSIIDFLKLHYVLTDREDSIYWRENKDASTIPESLADSLAHWKFHPPWHEDNIYANEMFPAASYQYVLYGMGFNTQSLRSTKTAKQRWSGVASQCFENNNQQSRKLCSILPTNRELINKIYSQGMHTI
ncbi:MAG: tryptophan halogenase [Cellvibrionales bacterium TMED49]|nr:tryptophan halogenase [Porticoccaceae bacterium]OUU37719.1 MAG: tryptophan halogenase [Cellvibrionales bacterium TMED49]